MLEHPAKYTDGNCVQIKFGQQPNDVSLSSLHASSSSSIISELYIGSTN